MKKEFVDGSLMTMADAMERFEDQWQQAVDGDTVAQDYCRKQIARIAKHALLVLYFMERGIAFEEADFILKGIGILTGWGISVRNGHESHGERRGR